MIINELLRKWFGLLEKPCEACEVLKESLSVERQFNKVLLQKLLDKDKLEPLSEVRTEEIKPVMPQFVPWRVRQQMFEAEDRKKAQLMRESAENVEKLEKELGIYGNTEQQVTQQ
jgi:hypothetical protein